VPGAHSLNHFDQKEYYSLIYYMCTYMVRNCSFTILSRLYGLKSAKQEYE